jgi:hypothetical protein
LLSSVQKKKIARFLKKAYTRRMNILAAFILFCICFLAMALGLILSKKALKKGCGQDPNNPDTSCSCQGNDQKCQE